MKFSFFFASEKNLCKLHGPVFIMLVLADLDLCLFLCLIHNARVNDFETKRIYDGIEAEIEKSQVSVQIIQVLFMMTEISLLAKSWATFNFLGIS